MDSITINEEIMTSSFGLSKSTADIITKITMDSNCSNCCLIASQYQILASQIKLLENKLITITSMMNTSMELYNTNSEINSYSQVNSCANSIVTSTNNIFNNCMPSEEGNNFNSNVQIDAFIYDMDHDNPDVVADCDHISEVDNGNNTDNKGVSDLNVSCNGDIVMNPWHDGFYENISDSGSEISSLSETNVSISTEDSSQSDVQSIEKYDQSNDIYNSIENSTKQPPYIRLQDAPFKLFDMEALHKTTEYTQSFKNRKTAYYGEYPYSYSGAEHEPRDLSTNGYLYKLLSYVDIVVPGYQFNSALINYYPDSSAHLPPHGDTEQEIVPGSHILTISLGATRAICFTTKQGKWVCESEIEHGEAFFMSQTSQSLFNHSIPEKKEDCGPRISVTLRLLQPLTKEAECGYVPYENSESPKSNIHTQPVIEYENWSQKGNKNSTDDPIGITYEKYTTVYISSSMFRYLSPAKLSSDKQDAEVCFYSGADASQMFKRVKEDEKFLKITPSTVNKVVIMVGTNNVEKVYQGDQDLEDVQRDVVYLLDFIKHRFTIADVLVVNVLPRSVKGKNDVVKCLNIIIEDVCKEDPRLTYIDTEEKDHIFTDNFGLRRHNYFIYPSRSIPDNVHLNSDGVIRLGRHLKFITHNFEKYIGNKLF